MAAVPAAYAGLAIRQRSNGVPGKARGERTEQKMLVGAGRIRIDDASDARGRSIVVRLDKGVIWEIDPKLEMYTETRFQHYRKQREEAEKDRAQAREVLLEKLENGMIDEKDLEERLAKKGLRRDGARLLDVERGRFETVAGARCERVAILLNGVTQVAVWQTDKYKGQYTPPQEIFDVYDKCGFFAEDVARKLKSEVTLFPARIYANIDLYSVGGEIETEIEAVAAWVEEAAKFEVPGGYRLVKDFPKEEIAKQEYRCPKCGAKVDPIAAPFSAKDPATGKKAFFDDESHWIEFVNKGWTP